MRNELEIWLRIQWKALNVIWWESGNERDAPKTDLSNANYSEIRYIYGNKKNFMGFHDYCLKFHGTQSSGCFYVIIITNFEDLLLRSNFLRIFIELWLITSTMASNILFLYHLFKVFDKTSIASCPSSSNRNQ